MPGAVSVEPEASTVQVACGQVAVNDATGATFGRDPGNGGVGTPDLEGTDRLEMLTFQGNGRPDQMGQGGRLE